MTLFKKVFQNQARPANPDEALDEDELRAAFTAGDDALSLDPFSVTESSAEADDLVEASEYTPPLTDILKPEDPEPETGDVDIDVVDAGAQIDADKGETEAPDEEVAESEEQSEAVSDADDEVSDADIAAVLDRALVDEVDGSAVAGETAADESVCSVSEDESIMQISSEEPHEISGDTESTVVQIEPGSAALDELDIEEFARKALLTPVAQSETSRSEARHDDVTDPPASAPTLTAVPAPAKGRAGRQAGRVKTRLLGFNRDASEEADPFGQVPDTTATAQREKFPVGWLVIVEGPGMGYSFSLFSGASVIGRGDDQVIRLDFGDNSISRNNHAAIAYDEEQNKFYIGHGGKSNIIRRNARPVLSTEELHHADLIRIGETTLRFVALCGSDFKWNAAGDSDAAIF
ncbi:MAG: FHA domain-containing protein [Pseudomonadota bacterium]